MSFLRRLPSIVPPVARGDSGSDYTTAFFNGDDMPGSWGARLTAAGVTVTPDLAMTLSAYYCGVTTIAYDLATLPLEIFKLRADGGKDPVTGGLFSNAGGIGSLAYRLRWQPNRFQTAAEYLGGQIAQFLLRRVAYAEIVDGPTGFLEQLLPRHPDRVTPQRLPNGQMTYKLIEANGQPRYLTEEEMHIVRDLATDPISGLSRVAYGANAIGTGLAAERAAGKFFKSGMTASVVATYKGDSMEDEEEVALHRSISRYAAGVENSFGLLLVPDDVTVTNLGVEPDKAQMMLAREWTVFEVARHLRIPPRKLMAAKTTTYASAYQDQIDYAVGTVRPIARTFEQAVKRDLILAKDSFEAKFNLHELMQGDPEQLGDFIEKLITTRAMTPSEVRMRMLDMNPDPALDKLSEGDNRPGQKTLTAGPTQAQHAVALLGPVLGKAASAVTCVRRERSAVTKLAQKHARDVEGWQVGLREFYADHALFVADTMNVPIHLARGYVAEHGSAFEANGIVTIDGDAGARWERDESTALATLALMQELA